MSDETEPGASGRLTGVNPLGTRQAPVTPGIDTVFELLANDERREICLYLMGLNAKAVAVEELVDVIADEETDRERLGIDLHHRHLPKLAHAGIIEYDPRSNTARYWGQPTVEKWAEHVTEFGGCSEGSAP